MSNKIYVGNLSFNTQESELSKMFESFGEVVSAKIIEDQYTGKSKGFAFVEMSDKEAATAAISALNGKEVGGRNLKVNEALDKPRNSYRN